MVAEGVYIHSYYICIYNPCIDVFILKGFDFVFQSWFIQRGTRLIQLGKGCMNVIVKR